MNPNTDYIKEKFKEAGISLFDEQAAKFLKYYELLVSWNEKFNLTAITDFEDVVTKHFVDSCLGAEFIDKTCKLCDIGTGAGFPGVPLKILYPSLEVFLLDSLRKRVDFLNTVISELELEDIRAMHGRAEEVSRKPEYREQYDVCVSRAVAALSSLSEICIPFVKKGGKFIAYKSQKANEELTEAENAVKILGGSASVHERELFDAKRIFVVISKISNTPAKYPRAGGKPFSKPL